MLDALALPPGPIVPEQARGNVVTRHDLNAVVGRQFTIGRQRLTVPGMLRALVHRGGLRADVLSDGVIRVGAASVPVPNPGIA